MFFKKKKIGLFLLTGFGFAFVFFANHIVDFRNNRSLYEESTPIEIGVANNNSTKKEKGNNEQAESFVSLADFWQKHFPQTNIEADYNSLASAAAFFNIYQPLAKQGDLSAKYLVSRMVNNCLAADYEYSSKKNAPYFDQNKFSALLNDYQRCKELLATLSEIEKQSYLHNSFIRDAFSILLPKVSVDLNELTSIPLSKAKIAFYQQFNSGTEGVLRESINMETAILFEAISRVKNPISLHASFSLLSTQALGTYKPFNTELTAWLLASCASGFGCSDNFSMTGGFAVFCSNQNVECYNKSPEELVSKLAPDAKYEEILKRAWVISKRISSGEQERLLLELLSKMSPENARVFASLQNNIR
jgi:hypothetical protein